MHGFLFVSERIRNGFKDDIEVPDTGKLWTSISKALLVQESEVQQQYDVVIPLPSLFGSAFM